MNPHLNQERVEILRNKIKGVQPERLSQWPREHKMLPVVELDVNWVRFSVQNHRTQGERLRLCRNLGAPEMFSVDPLGPAAQNAQFDLLRKPPKFDDLKADLAERGQQEASVVTAEGVLINGNRRAAALRELFTEHHLRAKYIRCLVLPEDATSDELRILETGLQVSERFEEKYSWVNRGFLIDELLSQHNQDFEMVAKLMRMEIRKVEDEYRAFRQLDQLVGMSDGTYMHVDFELHESAFDELAKHVANKEPEEANAVRSAYFLGTLSKCKYRDLRNLKRPDALQYIEREINKSPILRDVVASISDDSARRNSELDCLLSDALGPDGDSARIGIDNLLTVLARSKPENKIEIAPGREITVEGLFQHVNTAVTQAANDAEEDNEDAKKVQAPAKYVRDAKEKLCRAAKILPQARALPDWDENEYYTAVTQLRETLIGLDRL